MDYNLITNIKFCSEIVSEMMSGNTNLLYYAHIPALVISLFMGAFVFLKSKRDIVAKVFFIFCITFSLWAFFNLISWVSSNSSYIMFSWSLLSFLASMFYVLSLYFVLVYLDKKDISFAKKMILSLLILPLIIFTPTVYNLSGFDFNYCSAFDNLFFGYVYIPQIISAIWITIFLIYRYVKGDKEMRKQIILLGSGIGLFLLTFFGAGYIADNYEIYRIEIYGLFAMVVFMGFLAYLIVRFKAFNIKLVLAQALVIGMIILIGSQYFFIQNPINRILTGITLVLVTFFGWWLAKSVKKEVEQREKLEILTHELKTANIRLQELDQQKTEFLSIASHQLRTPLSILKGYIELIRDGAYGKTNPKLIKTLDEMDESNERLVKLVDEFLDITRIEQGRTKFVFKESDASELIESVVKELTQRGQDKGLEIAYQKSGSLNISMDDEKIRHVVFNYIDNAIKYSDSGTISVFAEKENNGIAIRVSDEGFGFGEEDEASFFTKFYRGRSVMNTNVNGTGLGLFVCKKFVEAHGGHVWAKSGGLGKGSEFGMWIPFGDKINTNQVVEKEVAFLSPSQTVK